MGQVRIVRGWSVLIFLLSPGLVDGGEAPEVEWTVVLPSHFPDGRYLEKTSDGGFILSGNGLLKTDELGGVLWETPFEGVYPGPAVRQLKDGQYILGGTFYGNGEPTFVTSQDVALIKIDPQGTILWQKAFGGEGEDAGFAVEVTTDGGYAVTGHKAGLLYIVRTDRDGHLLWEATYVNGGGNSLQETRDGGFIVVAVGPEGAFLLKVDSEGNRLWEKLLGEDGVSLNSAGAVRVTEDGGYLVAGGMTGAGEGTASFLWKTDGEGNLLWRNRFPGPAGLCWLASLDLTSDGGAVAVGSVQVPRDGHVYGEVDVYVVRVDQVGELLWEKRLLTPDVDTGHGVVQTPDGGYAVSTKAQIDPGQRYATLIKLGPEPILDPFLRRGDVGGEGVVNLSDAVLTLQYLFAAGSEPSCLDSSDADDDGEVTITDGIVILQFLFLGGQPPRSPGPFVCGPDPTLDGLSCRTVPSCEG